MRKAILAILTICGLVGVLLGCSNPLGNPQDDAATGTVLVQVAAVGAADASARTVGPSAADFAEYRLVFAQDTTVIAEVMTQDENGKAFDLKPGTWTLTVTGYIDVDGEKKAAVSGTSTVTIAAGRTISATVSLSQSVTDTYGTFDYSAIDFSAVEAETLTGAALTITPSNPNKGTVKIDLLKENNSGTLELPAGIYTALVELTSGRSITIGGFNHALNAYREEAIYIYPYMTTALRAGEYEFTETDFIADLYFTGTAVIDADSTGTDTYTPKRVFIIKAVDNEGYVIDSDVPFEERLIAEAEIDEEGNWELYIPSNSIADKIKAPFSSHGEYQDLSGYPVFFAFEMQSQQHPANTMQSRWVWQEIVNKHGKRDIELKATIRKITVPITWGTVEGGSAVQTNSGYDVVYVENADDTIKLTVNTGNRGIIKESVKVVKVVEGKDVELTEENDELEVVSDLYSVFITFKMPDDDVTVTAQFFIPKGGVLVHSAEDSSASYTARQVFVWLDDGNDGDPISVGTVTGGSWEFDLPPEYQAYSGNFRFQFRLTSNTRPTILSKKFTVNVNALATDAETTISLPVEIRSLTFTASSLDSAIGIVSPDVKDEYGKPDDASAIPSGGYVAEGTKVEVTVTPPNGKYVAGVKYTRTDNMLIYGYAIYQSGGADNSAIYTFTMPDYNTTITAVISENPTLSFTQPPGSGSIAVTANATAVTSGGSVPIGATVQVTVTPDTGNQVSGLKYAEVGNAENGGSANWASDGANNSKTYTFTMPDYNTVLTPEFTSRKLTTAATTGGAITSTSPTPSNGYVQAGATVRVTVTPDGSNYVTGLRYAPTSDLFNTTSATMYDINSSTVTYSFTMPNYDTTVTADIGTPASAYAVGDTGPAGGLIFYVASTADTASQGWKYLEAAPADVPSPYTAEGDSYVMDWMSLPYNAQGEDQQYYTVSTSQNIGTGRQNTLNMIQAVLDNEGSANYTQFENGAAKAVDTYTVETYDDWFLPSLGELSAMYTAQQSANSGGFQDESYWSSTGYDGSTAYAVNFTNGGSTTAEKHFQYFRVRPIRAF